MFGSLRSDFILLRLIIYFSVFRLSSLLIARLNQAAIIIIYCDGDAVSFFFACLF